MKKTTSSHTKIWLIAIFGIIIGSVAIFLVHFNQFNIATSQNTQSNETLPFSATVISPQGVHIKVRVADTDETKELGLSYFKSLPEKQGMLFVFPQLGIYSFWMKGMNFPIDIIWLDENLKIVDRLINVDPSTYPETYTPSASAAYVLEISANTADQYGFTNGSIAELHYNE
jgi:uncharacterized membrane protein (UPF0127 family)